MDRSRLPTLLALLAVLFATCFAGTLGALVGWHVYQDHLLVDVIRQNAIQQQQQQLQQLQQQQQQQQLQPRSPVQPQSP